jgi:DNA-binding HxlR family transcriptional regulator/putative sterol carrier protein
VRSYNQYCGVARALDLVGERWALLVVRDLVLGPKRFTDLQSSLPGIGTNVLSTRLRELEASGVVERRALPPPAASIVYELTAYGREIEPALLALGRWGATSLGRRDPEQQLRSGWVGVAMRAFADGEAAPGLSCTSELRLDHGVFHARVEDGQVVVVDGPAPSPDVVVETTAEVLLGMLVGAIAVPAAVAAGAATVEGEVSLFERITDVFRFRLASPDAAEA